MFEALIFTNINPDSRKHFGRFLTIQKAIDAMQLHLNSMQRNDAEKYKRYEVRDTASGNTLVRKGEIINGGLVWDKEGKPEYISILFNHKTPLNIHWLYPHTNLGDCYRDMERTIATVNDFDRWEIRNTNGGKIVHQGEVIRDDKRLAAASLVRHGDISGRSESAMAAIDAMRKSGPGSTIRHVPADTDPVKPQPHYVTSSPFVVERSAKPDAVNVRLSAISPHRYALFAGSADASECAKRPGWLSVVGSYATNERAASVAASLIDGGIYSWWHVVDLATSTIVDRSQP